MRHPFAVLLVLGFGVMVAWSCANATYAREIVLMNYRPENYEMLNSALGENVCVVGVISADANAARFYLEPSEVNGVINTAPSRVSVDFAGSERLRRYLQHGERQRVCGMLVDATPWRSCEVNSCRWYELQSPRPG